MWFVQCCRKCHRIAPLNWRSITCVIAVLSVNAVAARGSTDQQVEAATVDSSAVSLTAALAELSPYTWIRVESTGTAPVEGEFHKVSAGWLYVDVSRNKQAVPVADVQRVLRLNDQRLRSYTARGALLGALPGLGLLAIGALSSDSDAGVGMTMYVGLVSVPIGTVLGAWLGSAVGSLGTSWASVWPSP